MGYAQYIGRVGALAVALGVGAAVATGQGPGLARADEPDSTSSSVGDSPPDTASEPVTAAAPSPEPTPSDIANGTPPDQPAATPPAMNYSNSGAPDTSTNDTGQHTDATTPSTPEPAPPPDVEPTASLTPPQTSDNAQRSDEPLPVPPPAEPVAENPPGGDDSDHVSPSAATTLDETAVAVTSYSRLDSQRARPEESRALTAAAAPAPSLTPAPSDPVAGLLALPGRLVDVTTTFVAALLAPFLAPGPAAPVQPPVLWAVLAWVRREVGRAFFNTSPGAVADGVTTSEDTDVDIDVLANDTDADDPHGTLAVVGYTQAAHGDVVLNGDGSFTYTPDADYSGADSFTYSVSDEASAPHVHGLLGLLFGGGHSQTGTVTVTVTPVDDAPTANPDTYTTAEDNAVIIDALSNDTDPDDDVLDRTLVTGPRYGTLAEINDGPDAGAWTYTPNADFNGVDTFTYRAFDGTTLSDAVTVTVDVTPVNDAPTAVNDTYGATEDTTLTVSGAGVLGNDTDVDSDALTAHLVTGPANGTLDLHADGSFTYTPTPNSTDAATFTYRTYDGTTYGNTASVTIAVTAVADPPVAIDDTFRTAEDTALSGNVLANDRDVDTVTLTARLLVDAAQGTAVVNADGSFTYTPAANVYGPDRFTYVVSDGTSEAFGTVDVIVTAVNDAPTAVDDGYSATEGTSLTVGGTGVLGNDTDVDLDALTAHLVAGPATGTLDLNADGSFTYAPAGTGTVTFTYRTYDGTAYSNTATVTITVETANNPPVASPDSYATLEDSVLSVVVPNGVTGNDSDVDDNAALVATVVTQPEHGTLDFNSNGTFTYTPAANFNGTDSFTYRVSDGALDSNIATVTITVTAVADAPVAVDDEFTTNEDTPVSLNVTRNDVDGDGDLLFIATVGQPAHGTLTQRIGSLIYTPDADFRGTDSFTYTVTDGTGVSNTATVTITVASVNDAPVANPDSYTTVENRALVVTVPNGVTGNDSDVDDDAALVATVVAQPGNGTVALNPNGTFTYTPATDFHGTDSFTYRVSDGALDSFTATVTITVSEYISPIVARDDAYTMFIDGRLEFSPALTANDTNGTGNPLGAVTIVAPPTNGTLFESGGVVTYFPMNGYIGTDTFTYTVADGVDPDVVSNVATVTVTVKPLIAAGDDTYTVFTGSRFEITPAVSANDTTVLSSPLGAVTIVTETTHGILFSSGGVLVYQSEPDFVGTDTFTYTVADSRDPAIVSNVATVTINVIPYNPLTAKADAYRVLADTSTVLTPVVTANDTSDLRRDLGAVTIVSGPAHGSLTNTDGRLTYTPTAGYVGTDTFAYTVADSLDPTIVSVPGTVTLTVVAVSANDDAYAVPADTTIVITPTANDATSTGNPLSAITVVSGPTYGTLDTTNGVLTYTPDTRYVGIDTFTYTVADSANPTVPSNLATVTLTVLPYTPVDANDDAYTVRTGEVAVLTPVVTANDSSTYSASLGAVTIVTDPTHGLVTVRDGVLTYRSQNDFTGIDSFTYTVADGADPGRVSNPATVTITVVATRALTARDDTVTVFTDEPIELVPSIHDNDFSETGNAYGAVTVLLGPTNGTLTQTNGTLTYTPDAGFNGVDSLVYTVADSVDPSLVSNAATVTLTVRDPISTNYDYYATSAGVAIELTFPTPTDNDDTYTGEPLAAPTISTQPLNGRVTVDRGVLVYTPRAGFTGLDTFYYTVTDSVNPAYSDTGLVFITVSAAD